MKEVISVGTTCKETHVQSMVSDRNVHNNARGKLQRTKAAWRFSQYPCFSAKWSGIKQVIVNVQIPPRSMSPSHDWSDGQSQTSTGALISSAANPGMTTQSVPR